MGWYANFFDCNKFTDYFIKNGILGFNNKKVSMPTIYRSLNIKKTICIHYSNIFCLHIVDICIKMYSTCEFA